MDEEHELSPEIVHRRKQIQEQQAAVLRGETPPPIAPLPEGESLRCTQVPNRYSSVDNGSHQELTRDTGSQKENTRDHSFEDRPSTAGARAPESDQPVSLDLPVTEHIRLAAEMNAEALETAQRWQGSAWTFCRYMMSHPEFQGLNSQQALDRLNPILESMFPQAQNPWEEVFDFVDSMGNFHDPIGHLMECWDLVENALGESPIEQAVRLAEEHPLKLSKYRSRIWEPFLRFLSICHWLQEIVGDEPFFAPVRKFAEVLRVSPASVSNYRRYAEREGYLVLVKEHEGRQKATEFRFVLEALYPGMDTEEQAADGEWGEIE